MRSFWTVAEHTAQKHEIWLLVRLAWFLWCPIKTSVVASKPKIQIRSTKNYKKKDSLLTSQIACGCHGSTIAFSPFPRHSLTIAPAIMLQFWGHLHWPWLWEGISLTYMKFYFRIFGWIMCDGVRAAHHQSSYCHGNSKHTDNTVHGAILPPDRAASWNEIISHIR